MDDERDAIRLRYATTDDDIRAEKILTEIMLGVAKQDSVAVISDGDSRHWDDIVSDIARIKTEREAAGLPFFIENGISAKDDW